jgi:chaperonin cofactor prefoldin
LKTELDEKIEKLEVELRLIMAIDPKLEEEFHDWTTKVYEKCHQI